MPHLDALGSAVRWYWADKFITTCSSPASGYP